MNPLENLLNQHCIAFDTWQVINHRLSHQYQEIYSFYSVIGDDEITFYMMNGLIIELQLINNEILMKLPSLSGTPNKIMFKYQIINMTLNF
jgi:hypothetical protein